MRPGTSVLWSSRTGICTEEFLTKDLVKQDHTCLSFVHVACRGGESRGRSHSAKTLIIVSSLTQLKSESHLEYSKKFHSLHPLYYKFLLQILCWNPNVPTVPFAC